jgi:dTDP-4-dehydrorhamnose reductase
VTTKIERDFGVSPRPWREAIDSIVDQLLSKEREGA